MTWKTKPASSRAVGTIVVALVAVLAVAAVGTGIYLVSSSGAPSPSCSAQSSQPSAQVVHVSIYSGASNSNNPPGYTPDAVALVVGVNNTVTWTNNDAAAHTITSTSAPACGQFDSGRMNSGATYTYTFTVPGTYQYHCSYHSWMTGTIVVKPAQQNKSE